MCVIIGISGSVLQTYSETRYDVADEYEDLAGSSVPYLPPSHSVDEGTAAGDDAVIETVGIAIETETALPAPDEDDVNAPEFVAQIDEAPSSGERVIDPELPMVALTFDDGPNNIYTPQVLDILEEHGAVATFFVIGSQVRPCRDVVLRAYELGCEIGNHSWSHLRLTRYPEGTIREQLEMTNTAIEAVTGEGAVFFRPPYGAENETVTSVAAEFGMPLIFWSIDPSDYLVKDADVIFEQIMERVTDGSVILLHDLYETSVEAAKMLIPTLIEEGYQLVTIRELFAYNLAEIVPGGHYDYFDFISEQFSKDAYGTTPD